MNCIYISDEYLGFVNGKVSGKNLKIKRFVRKQTDCANTENGTLKDKLEFAQVVQSFLDDTSTKERNTYVVLDNPRLVLKEMDLPFVDDKKFKILLANEVFPDGKMNNNIVDYVIDEVYKSEDKKKRCKARVSFLSNELIDEIKDVLIEMRLKPIVMDIAPNAVSKIPELYAKTEMDEIYIVLDYKVSFVTVYLFANSKLLFSKSSVMYARPAKDNETEYEFFYSEIVNLLQSVMQFSISKYNYYPSRIYVTGEIEHLQDSLQDMADSLGLGIRQLTPPQRMKGVDVLEFDNMFNAICALYRRKG